MNTHRRVLVLWSDNRSANLGVRVLASGAEAVARQVWPTSEVVHQDFAPNAEGFALGRSSIQGEFLRRSITRWASQFDAVLDTGAGDSFADIYGLKRLFMMTVAQRAIVRAGVPHIMLPQTIGPFKTRIGRAAARRTIRAASLVFARDPRSAQYTQAVSDRNAIESTDLVFALPTEQSAERFDILFNVSGLLWSSNKHGSSEHYRDQVRRSIRGLLMTGRRIDLLPHVLDNPTPDNDMVAVDALRQEFPDLGVRVPRSLEDARKVIAGADLVVGSRMHACLNAISQGVPAIAWAYSRKFEPLLGSLGWSRTIDLNSGDDAVSKTVTWANHNLRAEAESALIVGRTRISQLSRTLRTVTFSA